MNGLRVLLVVTIICCPLRTLGGGVQQIELIDGSRIEAEVVSLHDGIYTLRSESLGKLEIPLERIRSIRIAATEDAVRAPSSLGFASRSQLDGLHAALLQDPANLERIHALQDDPLVQSILNDEQTMRAINAGDLGALLNDPKIEAFMNHPTVRDLGEGIVN